MCRNLSNLMCSFDHISSTMCLLFLELVNRPDCIYGVEQLTDM